MTVEARQAAGVTVHEYDSASRRAQPVEEFFDLIGNRGILSALISRNIKVRYKRSVFGFAWTMAQPVAMIVVLTLIFSKAFTPQAGFYPAYLGPALLLWYFFAQTTAAIAGEVAAGVEVWRRIRIPKTALAVATTATGLFNLTMALIPLIVLFALLGRPAGPALLTLPLVVLLTAMFTLGLALIIAAIALYFPDVADMYQIVLTAWMFVTPVIYPRTILPDAVARLVALNPMTLFIDAFRLPFNDNSSASPEAFAAMFLIASATLLIGWYVFTRRADEIPYRA